MKKMSITHESIGLGTLAEGYRLKDLLITMFIPIIDEVLKNDPGIRYTEDLNPSYSKQFLVSAEVSTYSILPINDGNNVSGYIMCEWSKKDTLDGINIEDFEMDFLRKRDIIEFEIESEIRKKYKLGKI